MKLRCNVCGAVRAPADLTPALKCRVEAGGCLPWSPEELLPRKPVPPLGPTPADLAAIETEEGHPCAGT